MPPKKKPKQHRAVIGGEHIGDSGSPLAFADYLAKANGDMAISEDARDRLRIFNLYLRGISGGQSAQTGRTNISNGYCCAEPKAVAYALASGIEPEDLIFDSIIDIHSGEDRDPCTTFCGLYITDNCVNWNYIVAEVERQNVQDTKIREATIGIVPTPEEIEETGDDSNWRPSRARIAKMKALQKKANRKENLRRRKEQQRTKWSGRRGGGRR